MIGEITSSYTTELKSLSGNYERSERETWAEQKLHALNYKVNGEDYYIEAFAAAREEEPSVLADKILSKAKEYDLARIKLHAKYQKLMKAIHKAQSKEDLKDCTW